VVRVLDPGHVFELTHLDGDGISQLVFVKREGDGYPGNVGHHEGTTIQEVLRALIKRVAYVMAQEPCDQDTRVMVLLRDALRELEVRAATRRGELEALASALASASSTSSLEIEDVETCQTCGHVGCHGGHRSPTKADRERLGR
jgi:hypothetical protein